jgi:LysR family hydrogen peroxide-inducible transcriptional activator
MTLTQLEYIVAVERLKSFQKAADACFVTQPTLSQQVQKIENLLGVMIFDRSKQPAVPTPMGEKIIAQARTILQEANKIKSMISEEQFSVTGVLRLGIIPTLAPFLLPRFIRKMNKNFPGVDFEISEVPTELLVKGLREDRLDVGLLVTPLHHEDLIEKPVYYEPLFIYTSPDHRLNELKKINEKELSQSDVYLLSEGHCFRDQVLNLCRVRKGVGRRKVSFESGSLQTLKRLVDETDGYTILPELAAEDLLSAGEKNRLKPFADPVPVREISLVTHKSFVKAKMLEALESEIKKALPVRTEPKKREIVAVQHQGKK